MALSNGSRLGPYEILSPLGAGGMGEVYRATDTKLKRLVAIKILPTDLATDIGRLARFQREAEVLASLNHPHIAAIYGFEESGGVGALVMELVEGPTLADRIEQGPIPIEEALPIARQIADALEAAHERGIVHRDLKPANIKVRDDGTVKVLDFGLAKAVDHSTESSDFSRTVEVANSPTIASPAMSQVGVILGTAAYMSPEQARGRPVDKRTDVWAFGAVLYEMLSGTRAFEGEDITELMAAVVKSTPNWAQLPANVPPTVITLIQRCLEKDRKTRIGDIAVARFLLSGDAPTTAFGTTAGAATSRPSRPGWLSTLPWIAAALIAGAAIGWMLPRQSSSAPEAVHLQTDVSPANFVTPSTNAGVRPSRTAIALSPDGRRLIFAGTRDGAGHLYARSLDRSDSTPLEGTDGAISPFVSPDGAWIGFAAKGKLQKVPAAGGPATAICDLAGPIWGATWADDGNVYFAVRDGIFKVKSGGGTPEAVTKSDLTKADRLLLPQALPGSKALLVTSPPNLILFPLDGGQERTIVEGGSDGRYVPSGHIVFMKAGTLMAVPFNLGSLQVNGPPAAIVEGVMHGVNAGNSGDETLAGQFAISNSGTLLYAEGGINPGRTTTLVWVDRKGVSQQFAPAGRFLFPRLSPDGRKVAVVVRAETSRDGDLWMYDAERATPTRLTFDGAGSAVWSPDGKRLVFSAGGLHLINADGSSKPQPIGKGEFNQTPASWSPGTDTIAFMQRPTLNTYGLWALPMRGGTTGTSAMFLESKFLMTHPTFSPDGRWIAYVSTESGGAEVYVQGYPTGEKTRVSTEGGFEPLWTGNGKEILFRSGQDGRRFFSAEVRSLSPLQIDRPRLLFESKPGEFDSTTPVRNWDATADGQRFLLAKNPESMDRPVTALHVVLNWTEELKRRVR